MPAYSRFIAVAEHKAAENKKESHTRIASGIERGNVVQEYQYGKYAAQRLK